MATDNVEMHWQGHNEHIGKVTLRAESQCTGPVAGETDAPITPVYLVLSPRAFPDHLLLHLPLHLHFLLLLNQFDRATHPLRAHPFASHAHADVAVFSLRLFVLTR